jgi:hypothetical protein
MKQLMLLPAFFVLIASHGAWGQSRSRTEGWVFGFDGGGVAVSFQHEPRDTGPLVGARVGYGSNRITTAFVSIYEADVDVRNFDAFDTVTFGHVDLGVRLHLANRRAIERAIESSQVMYPGGHAPAHGLAAWEMWLKAFHEGTVSVNDIANHAGILIDARTAAAIYLTEVTQHFPEGAHEPLRAAAGWYDEVVDAMRDLRDLRDLGAVGAPDLQEGAVILAKALEAEHAALMSLQQVLDARYRWARPCEFSPSHRISISKAGSRSCSPAARSMWPGRASSIVC